MNRALLATVALCLWTASSTLVGWKWRDDQAKAEAAKQATTQQTQRADNAEQARATDASNTQAGAQAQQQRTDTKARIESTFQLIEHKANAHAQSTSYPAGCVLDGDGLRAWREANTGPTDDAQPVHIGGPADGTGAAATAAGQRQPARPDDEPHRSGEGVSPAGR